MKGAPLLKHLDLKQKIEFSTYRPDLVPVWEHIKKSPARLQKLERRVEDKVAKLPPDMKAILAVILGVPIK